MKFKPLHRQIQINPHSIPSPRINSRREHWNHKYKPRYVTLNNGREIMACGFGTWQATVPGEAGAAVLHALKSGQRHLDLADRYGNQAEIGEMALEPTFQEGEIKREEVFITTKLWGTDHRPARVQPAVHEHHESFSYVLKYNRQPIDLRSSVCSKI